MEGIVFCELCGAKARHMLTKEFDGKWMSFCCRSCLGMYELLRAEDLVQTGTEDRILYDQGMESQLVKFWRPAPDSEGKGMYAAPTVSKRRQ